MCSPCLSMGLLKDDAVCLSVCCRSGAMERVTLHAETIANSREAIQVLKKMSDNAAVCHEYLAALTLSAPVPGSRMESSLAQELGVKPGDAPILPLGQSGHMLSDSQQESTQICHRKLMMGFNCMLVRGHLLVTFWANIECMRAWPMRCIMQPARHRVL